MLVEIPNLNYNRKFAFMEGRNVTADSVKHYISCHRWLIIPCFILLVFFVLITICMEQFTVDSRWWSLITSSQPPWEQLNIQRLNDLKGIEDSRTIGKPPVVLFWTRYFDYSIANEWDQLKESCSPQERRCFFTDDRRFVSSADAVVFHYRDVKWNQMPLTRLAHQRYVFMLKESPPNSIDNDTLYHPAFLNFQQAGFFNWTMTYRDKTKPIAWFVTNCDTLSRREIVARKLQKEIQVDVYGNCGPLKCPRNNEQACFKLLREQYYFYLAFENTVCRNYITEKFYVNALTNMVIPIVLSDHIYRDVVPAKSYIAVDSFPSLTELVKHLRYLMNNQSAYLEYFDWMNHYQIVVGDYSPGLGFCSLCASLQNLTKRNLGTKIYNNLTKWWHDQSNCQTEFSYL